MQQLVFFVINAIKYEFSHTKLLTFLNKRQRFGTPGPNVF